MARVCKSLVPPIQGYPHREHRSKKGRSKKNKPASKAKRFEHKLSIEELRYEEEMRMLREDWLDTI